MVGILPPIPQFPSEVDVYMPTVACPTRSGEHALHERSWHMMNVYATLKPGVSLAEAQADLNQIAKRLQTAYPDDYPSAKGYEIGLQPVHEELSHDIRPVLIVLAAAVGLLLLLACANVTGIMVSRMLARTRELTVRTILGASRSRIVRGLVTEGVMLAIFGGMVGLILAYWSVGLLVSFTSKFTSLASQLTFTPQVIAFCFLLSVACGVVIGMVPSVGVRYTPLFTMEVGNASVSSRISSKTRGALVAAQLALCVILLVGAGLALRTVLHLERVDARVPTERGSDGANLHSERKAPGVLQATAGAHTTAARSRVRWAGEHDPVCTTPASDGPVPIEVREAKASSTARPNPVLPSFES